MQLYDAEAVGNLLGVTPATLCNWRTKCVGPGFIKRGHYCYYTAEKLEAYLDKIGPIPEGLDAWEKRRFFTEAHRPEVVHETPEQATVAGLADRLAVVEAELATLRENSPEALQERLRKAEIKLAARIKRNQKRKPLVPALPS
jgi:hypothetical protein